MKAEAVPVVVIEARVAIVGHGGDGQLQLINRGGVRAACGDAQGVIAGFLNAGDIVSGILNGKAYKLLCVKKPEQGFAGGLGLVGGDVVIVVAVNHRLKEIPGACALRKLIAPGGGHGLHRVVLRAVAV